MDGKNMECSIDGKGILTIKIDTKKNLGPSKSGKTQMIATSAGAVKVNDDISVNLNVYTKA